MASSDEEVNVTQARRWWPVPAFLAASLVAQKVLLESRYEISGHAAEHLASAGVIFAGSALVAILFYVTPGARRAPLVLLTSAAWLVGLILVLIGNVRVVDALVEAGMAHTSTSRLVENVTIASAHDLANSAPRLGVVAALGLTAALWRGRHISGRVAMGAGVLSVVFPPWVMPGAGVLVLVVARAMSHHRSFRDGPPPPVRATVPVDQP